MTKKDGRHEKNTLPDIYNYIDCRFCIDNVWQDAAMPLVIDVRTVQEWDKGHLEGAILIPYDQIAERIGSVVKDKSQRIYVYCRTGR